MLSILDRIIFLKEVPFFQSMTIAQLKILATFCEEKFFEKEARIFEKGEPGGVLYALYCSGWTQARNLPATLPQSEVENLLRSILSTQ